MIFLELTLVLQNYNLFTKECHALLHRFLSASFCTASSAAKIVPLT